MRRPLPHEPAAPRDFVGQRELRGAGAKPCTRNGKSSGRVEVQCSAQGEVRKSWECFLRSMKSSSHLILKKNKPQSNHARHAAAPSKKGLRGADDAG